MRFWQCAIGAAAVWSGISLMAQDAATPTLHVYVDLMQIPVLVLGPDRKPIKPIDAGRFRVSIDDGPLFPVTHQQLKWFMTIVRERYIVEFPRPYKGTAGQHDLEISIDGSNAFIRPTGVYTPIADPAMLADPMTVPSDASHAPQEGKHKVLVAP